MITQVRIEVFITSCLPAAHHFQLFN